MFRMQSNGWLIAAAAGFALAAPLTQAAESAGEENPLAHYVEQVKTLDQTGGEIQVAEAASAADALATTAGGDEKIEVTFEKPEEDLLTIDALKRLDVTVESLEFANADLRNVIRIIGERLDINFIFDAAEIDGKVTLRLRNVRLSDALDSILTTRQLAIVPDKSGIFRIVPQERVGRKAVETRTEVIALNWINATDVKKTLEPFITDATGRLEANEESNSLIITDVPPQIAIIKDLITQIDLPERQVLIEARLIDVNIGKLRTFRTDISASKLNDTRDWQNGTPYASGIGDVGTPGGLPEMDVALIPFVEHLDVANVLLEGASVKGGLGSLALGDTIGIFGDDYNVNAAFTALETNNIAEILANPRVTTLNNVPAQISIIEKIPYIEAVSGPSQGTATAEVEFADAGVDIGVKPIITPNGFVRLEVTLAQMLFRGRVSASGSSSSTESALDPPKIDERHAQTNVIVKSDQTIVLGGLRQQRSIEDISAVPFLHKIPLFGWLFKDKSNSRDKTELVLMMTPRIIEGEPVLNDQEKFWYDKIDTDWHLPDYFFDDVKNTEDL